MEKRLQFDGLTAFEMSINYHNSEVYSAETASDHHIHSECEIYINLRGDVSFMVEDKLYPIRPGSVIITRPHEFHHCIYHSKTTHRHFCILFSCASDSSFLDLFFRRETGYGNHIAVKPDKLMELTSICLKMGEENITEVDKYHIFFSLLKLLEDASHEKYQQTSQMNPEILDILKAIHENYAEPMSVKALAEQRHISISTLERWFISELGTTPLQYIKKIRLAHAVRLLTKQCSVIETAEKCGFADVSAMIACFKKQYGITPFQYKQSKTMSSSLSRNRDACP